MRSQSHFSSSKKGIEYNNILLCFNDMNSHKTHLDYALVLLLVTAFLAMQWTAVHMHLADQHAHDKTFHQHQIETHAHNLTGETVTANDFSHQASHADVIDLDHEASLFKREKIKAPSASVITSPFALLQAPVQVASKVDFVNNTKLRYLYRPSFNPRAPPLSS